MEGETTPTPTPAPNRGRPRSNTVSFMLERKLVTLRKVTQISSPFCLRLKCLEIVTVSDGPEVVVRKGKFNVGDWVLYFEVDSFIPPSVLKLTWLTRHTLTTFDGEKGYHVRSRMVGKHLSQGHIMEVDDHAYVRRLVNIMKEEYGPLEGLRVASMMAFDDVMGVKKWEPEDDSDTPTATPNPTA